MPIYLTYELSCTKSHERFWRLWDIEVGSRGTRLDLSWHSAVPVEITLPPKTAVVSFYRPNCTISIVLLFGLLEHEWVWLTVTNFGQRTFRSITRFTLSTRCKSYSNWRPKLESEVTHSLAGEVLGTVGLSTLLKKTISKEWSLKKGKSK